MNVIRMISVSISAVTESLLNQMSIYIFQNLRNVLEIAARDNDNSKYANENEAEHLQISSVLLCLLIFFFFILFSCSALAHIRRIYRSKTFHHTRTRLPTIQRIYIFIFLMWMMIIHRNRVPCTSYELEYVIVCSRYVVVDG